MKKLLIALFFVTLISNTAMAAVDDNGLWKMDDPVLSQFDGIVINGQTGADIQRDVRKETWQKFYVELVAAHEDYDATVEKLNSLIREEKSLRNITQQASTSYRTDPYDFTVFGSRVLHWLTENWKVLTCEHYSKEEVQNHAKIFSEVYAVWNTVQQKKENLKKIDSHEYINKRLQSAVFKAMEPFYSKKMIEMENELAQKKSKIKDITCMNENIGSKGISCRWMKNCKLAVLESPNGMLKIGCVCGHPLEQHEVKYRK